VSSRLDVLQAFEGRLGQVLSGAALASKLGLTRAAVWKQIRALQAAGVPLISTPRAGYCLSGTLDLSLLQKQKGSSSHSWGVIHHYFQTASTQRLAKAGAEQGAPEGHVWISETQSAGRGRLDRTWESGYGGIWMSLLLRPRIAPARVPPLALVAALTLSQTCESLTGVRLKLKWPNDLVILEGRQWKKVAGILAEMFGEVDRVAWIVVGVGLNVFNVLPKSIKPFATRLGDLTRKTVPRADLLCEFLRRFRNSYERFQLEGFQPFQKLYWERYGKPDQPVRLKTAQGEVSGIARGVDALGALLIESRRQIRAVSEGETAL
jgi:BirA family transcriptional regulator, biotin operon repressor / biotin---[acetyl-CoA-carboxylase] ligase